MHKRTVVFLRVSKSSSTTANQEYAMRPHIAKLGEGVEVITEVGSSWKKRLPILGGIMDRVERGQVDELHMWRVCRAGRDHENDCRLWNLCVRKGVRLFFVSEGLDSNREEDRDTFYQLSISAERERRWTAKRVREAFAMRRATIPGWRVGGRPVGSIGERTQRLTPAILALWDGGQSCKRIARDLALQWRTVSKVLAREGRK